MDQLRPHTAGRRACGAVCYESAGGPVAMVNCRFRDCHGDLRTAPAAKGVLFERPEVIAQAKSTPNPRINYVAGDFFKDAIPPCDLYVMMTLIHDWSDTDSITILKDVRAHAPEEARLLLAEAESASGRPPTI